MSAGVEYERKLSFSSVRTVKAITGFCRFLVCSVLVTALGCVSTSASKNGTLCDALRVFAESLDDSDIHQVTLRTEWGAEPAIACGPLAPAPERALCNYLIENSSIEFMAVNIERVLACVGAGLPLSSDPAHAGRFSGTVISDDPTFTDEQLDVVVSFDTASDGEWPSLMISMGKRAEY